MKRQIMLKEWEGFVSKVYPGVGELQKREMKLNFYAGAYALFTTILSNLTPGKDAELPDLILMDDIHTELEDFLKDYHSGVPK